LDSQAGGKKARLGGCKPYPRALIFFVTGGGRPGRKAKFCLRSRGWTWS